MAASGVRGQARDRRGFAGVARWVGKLCFVGIALSVASIETTALAYQNGSQTRVALEDLQFAHALLKERRYDQAAQEYEKYLKSKPAREGEAEARLGLARARLFLNEYQAAREQFEQFLKLAPEHPAAATSLFRVGETAYLSGDLAAARGALEEFTTRHPEHAQKDAAWPYLGDIYLGLGELARAQAAYEKALQIAPQGRLADRCRFFRGRALAAQGEIAGSVRAYDELAEKRVPEWSERSAFEAIQVLDKEGDPEAVLGRIGQFEESYSQSRLLPSVRRVKADVLVRAGRAGEAEAIWEELVRAAPRELALLAAERLAQQQMERKQPERARAVWQELDKRFRGLPQVEYRLAELQEREGALEAAEASYLQILARNPGGDWSALCRLSLARIALARRDGKRAQNLMEEARQAGIPAANQVEARLLQAQVFQVSGQSREAAADLEKLLGELHKGPQARLVTYHLAMALRSAGDAAGARPLFEEVETGARDDLAMRSALAIGQIALEQGEWPAAEAAFQRCLERGPEGETAALASACLAWAVHQAGDVARGRELQAKLEKAHAGSGAGDWLRVRLGEASVARGDDQAAWEMIAPVLARDGSPWLDRARLIGGTVKLRLGDAEAARTLANELTRPEVEASLRDEARLTLAQAEAVLGREEAAIGQLEPLIAGTSGDLQFRAELARARIWLGQGKARDAMTSLERVWERIRAGETKLKGDEVLADLARAAQESEEGEKVDAAYSELLAKYPGSGLAWEARFQLGESAYARRNWAEARKWYGEIVAPGSAATAELIEPALYRLGRIAAESRDWNEAVKCLRRQLQDYPDGEFHRLAGMWLGESLYQTLQYAEAGAAFRDLLMEEGKAKESWLGIARVRRGQCLVKLGDHAEAEGVLEGLDETALDALMRSEVALARGECLMARARFDEARQAFATVIQDQPRSELAARAQFLRGESYFHQEKWDEALREFEKTELLYAAPLLQSAALLEIGKVHEKRGGWSRAIAAYDKLINEYGETPAGREAVPLREAVRQKIARGEPGGTPVR